MDDQELEQILRAGLAERARDADGLGVDLAGVGRVVTARRRRRRVAGVVAVAAGIAVVAGVLVGVGQERESARPPVATDPTDGSPAPAWRAESWGGLTVDVPADWDHGGAPAGGGAEASACPAGPERPDSPGWVGRPIAFSDVCSSYPWIENSPQEQDATPYVWLGAAVEVGTVEWPSGLVQETVVVEGETLTVATTDDALRQQILASARPTTSCRASWGATIPSGSTGLSTEGRGDALDGVVCAYGVREGEFRLTYAAEVDPSVVDSAWQAQAEATPTPTDHDEACLGDVPEFVVVEARYDDPFGTEPLVQRAVYEMICAGEVSLGEGDAGLPWRTRMTRAGVEPWADPGIAHVVHAPIDGQSLVPLLIGLQG